MKTLPIQLYHIDKKDIYSIDKAYIQHTYSILGKWLYNGRVLIEDGRCADI
jgi:hypothetical protein